MLCNEFTVAGSASVLPEVSEEPNDLLPNGWLETLIDLSRLAGEQILEVYNSSYEVWEKSDQSPVTSADLVAHRTIVAGLQQLTPHIPILSEESKHIPFAERATWDVYWLVDPLDGTREFVQRSGQFSVNIALICHHRAVAGVVHSPVSGTTYYAVGNRPAYRQRGEQAPELIQVRPCQDYCIVVAGNRSRYHRGVQDFVQRLDHDHDDVQLIGLGSSLKSCLVAEGAADIYPSFGNTCEWDTAAAQCIIEQAGGLMVDMDCKPLRYNMKDSLINPHFLVIGDARCQWEQYLEAH